MKLAIMPTEDINNWSILITLKPPVTSDTSAVTLCVDILSSMVSVYIILYLFSMVLFQIKKVVFKLKWINIATVIFLEKSLWPVLSGGVLENMSVFFL